jgi:Ca2+-binding RTX toxin-like protein
VNVVVGGAGDDRIIAGVGTNNLAGGDGNDFLTASGTGTLSGGAGDDSLEAVFGSHLTLMGGDGNDELAMSAGTVAYGGAGADMFSLHDHAGGVVGGSIPLIEDWTGGQDKLYLDSLHGTITAANYTEQTAPDYASALSLANALIATGARDVVAVQVGADVAIFIDSGRDNGTADDVIGLVGRTLNDISVTDFL